MMSSRSSATSGRLDAAGDHPCRVDPLAAETFDDLLAEAAQGDAVASELRVVGGDAEEVAPGRVGVEAEQQVGRREVEEAEGVGLHDLGQVHDPAQLQGSLRRRDGEDLVARLGRRHEVAHRADSADPRHQRRHLAQRPALADALEAAELRDVEVGVGDRAGLVELDGDLGVALDAGDRVDDDLAHARSSQAPKWVMPAVSGMRPASSSSSTK